MGLPPLRCDWCNQYADCRFTYTEGDYLPMMFCTMRHMESYLQHKVAREVLRRHRLGRFGPHQSKGRPSL